MIKQGQLISLLDRALNQAARIRKGVEAVYFCPFCNHYKKKLEINVNSQSWHCWVCHSSGKSIKSLFRKLNVNSSYYNELYKITGGYQPQHIEKEYTQDLKLPDEFISLNKNTNTIEYNNAMSYLAKRNVSMDDILRYNIGYCIQGIYKNKIIIPSYDKDVNINFFAARSYYDGSQMKHMLSPWSKDIVGFELFINWKDPITLVEGTFDALAVKKNVIPLFGTIMSNKLKNTIIEKNVKRVNVILDKDALEEAMIIQNFLKNHDISVHLIQLDDKDPSILGFKKINELIYNSSPMEFEDLITAKLKL